MTPPVGVMIPVARDTDVDLEVVVVVVVAVVVVAARLRTELGPGPVMGYNIDKYINEWHVK